MRGDFPGAKTHNFPDVTIITMEISSSLRVNFPTELKHMISLTLQSLQKKFHLLRGEIFPEQKLGEEMSPLDKKLQLKLSFFIRGNSKFQVSSTQL